MNAPSNPEIAHNIVVAGTCINYHDLGQCNPELLIHGSGPGVFAWANWCLVIPVLAEQVRVIAPNMIGFVFYTDYPVGQQYTMDNWVAQPVGLLDALGIYKADLVGNSFGGGLALALSIRHPRRARRLVLMGSVGVHFPITTGLNAVWGYTPSLENMRKLLDIFSLPSTAAWSTTSSPACALRPASVLASRYRLRPFSRRRTNAGSMPWSARKTQSVRCRTRPSSCTVRRIR